MSNRLLSYPEDEAKSPSGRLRRAMEKAKQPPYVQYLPEDATVQLIESEQESSRRQLPRTSSSRCTKRTSLTVGVSVCLVAILICLASLLLVQGKPSSSAEPLTKFDLPDVVNLALLSSTENSITVTWEQPKTRFDYYWITISEQNRGKNATKEQHYMGSCSNGTTIHPSQNRVTCTNINACTNVTLTVHTQINGPPKRVSKGATMAIIFIAGQEPDAPKNITAIGISPTLTRLQWAPPSKMPGTRIAYTVKVCDSFPTCGRVLRDCKENETSHTWLEFESTVNTGYCIVVVANAHCGPRILRSPEAMFIFRTHSFRPSDVTDLKIIKVGEDFFTVNWTRPNDTFDYYSVKIDAFLKGTTWSNGSCADGTIIHRDRTELTCTDLEPRHLYMLQLYTHITGPPARTSRGASRFILTTTKLRQL
ncbi:fibronectin [Rhipicephalus sanguineus]|uniref:fibronectin n=1 Tax=Rhipicephalus sanguineus TaxID=34632 RepID=UPI0020C50F31|nr:fibronectin [Rhipicephalus sanguineus]